MLAALLTNIRTTSASFPIQQGRGKRPFWMSQMHPKEFGEAKKIAAKLKEASERLRAMPFDAQPRRVFEKLAEPYRLTAPTPTQMPALKAKLDHLEMALDAQTTADILLLLQWADEEEMLLLFS